MIGNQEYSSYMHIMCMCIHMSNIKKKQNLTKNRKSYEYKYIINIVFEISHKEYAYINF